MSPEDTPETEPDHQSDPALSVPDESVDWSSEGGAPVTGDESHDD